MKACEENAVVKINLFKIIRYSAPAKVLIANRVVKLKVLIIIDKSSIKKIKIKPMVKGIL